MVSISDIIRDIMLRTAHCHYVADVTPSHVVVVFDFFLPDLRTTTRKSRELTLRFATSSGNNRLQFTDLLTCDMPANSGYPPTCAGHLSMGFT